MYYSKKIRKLRTDKKVEVDEIACYLGITKNLYNIYERENEIFPIKYLNKLCEYFDVSLDYIFEFVTERNYKNNTHVIDKKVSGDRLKKMRLSLNLNQEHIADILNVSSSNISYYETGISIISTSNLYILCTQFNISADYLLGKTDEPKTIFVSEDEVDWKIEYTIYMYSNRLKYLREKNNIKREDLANIIGIHVKKYNQYEREYNILPIKHVNTICNYFDISIDYFLGLSDKEKYDNCKEVIDVVAQGKNIKLLRKKLGLSKDKLAKEVGTNGSTINNYENRKILISTKILYRICKKYNVSADFLLGKIDKTPLV